MISGYLLRSFLRFGRMLPPLGGRQRLLLLTWLASQSHVPGSSPRRSILSGRRGQSSVGTRGRPHSPAPSAATLAWSSAYRCPPLPYGQVPTANWLSIHRSAVSR